MEIEGSCGNVEKSTKVVTMSVCLCFGFYVCVHKSIIGRPILPCFFLSKWYFLTHFVFGLKDNSSSIIFGIF